MSTAMIFAFSLSNWFFAAWKELVMYFNMMDTTQWAIVSVSAVAFGFLCLKGNSLHN